MRTEMIVAIIGGICVFGIMQALFFGVFKLGYYYDKIKYLIAQIIKKRNVIIKIWKNNKNK